MGNNTSSETVVAEGVEVTGTIKSQGTIQWNGILDGDMHSQGDVTIGNGSSIKGDIHANSVTVRGKVTGTITAKDAVNLRKPANVSGDIKARRLTVEEGVAFNGRSDVSSSAVPSQDKGTSAMSSTVYAESVNSK